MNDKTIEEPIMIHQELSLDDWTVDRVNDINYNKRLSFTISETRLRNDAFLYRDVITDNEAERYR